MLSAKQSKEKVFDHKNFLNSGNLQKLMLILNFRGNDFNNHPTVSLIAEYLGVMLMGNVAERKSENLD